MDSMTNKFEEYEREEQEKSMKSDMVNMNMNIEKLEGIVGDMSNIHIAIASYCTVS